MKTRTGVLVAGVMVLGAAGSPMMARSQPGVPVDANPFLALIPALRTAPAPGWVKPGTRITYQSAAASVPGDPQAPGPAGQGFTQVTVVALDQHVAVLDVQIYTQPNGTGPAITAAYSGGIGLPGAGIEWWLSPQALRGVVGLSAPGLKVVQMRYPLGGREYNAIRFEVSDQTANQAWVYDADTGVLLFNSATNITENRKLLTQATLLGVRTPNIPWAQSPAPDWVGTTSVLRYEGSLTVNVPGASPLSVPISATFQRQHGGPSWVWYRQTTVQATPPGLPPVPAESVRITGAAQFGGLWIPPQGLRQLRPGQTLDVDPITGMTTSVARIGRTPQGVEAVTITESNQGQRADGEYDLASGALVSVSIVDNILHAQTMFQLVGRQ